MVQSAKNRQIEKEIVIMYSNIVVKKRKKKKFVAWKYDDTSHRYIVKQKKNENKKQKQVQNNIELHAARAN